MDTRVKPAYDGRWRCHASLSLFCLKPLSFSERENGKQPTKQPRYKGKKVGIGGWAVSTSAKIPSRSDKAERKNRQDAKGKSPNHPRPSPLPKGEDSRQASNAKRRYVPT